MKDIPAKNPNFVFTRSDYNGSWWKKSIVDDRPNKLIGHFDYLPEYVKKQVPWIEQPLRLV